MPIHMGKWTLFYDGLGQKDKVLVLLDRSIEAGPAQSPAKINKIQFPAWKMVKI
ncbi:MAG: hypothetical protein OEV64_10580 [Desulfobulbaceae bacterium]|nr:hypothetical protein [Desulfobulbaceae bacterium]